VLVGGLLAGVLALLLARRATQPIAQIARTAEAIRSGERPFQRIDYRGRDELGALAAVLDASFAELEDSLERQRRFGADASHELRTPIAAIRANIELLRGWAATQRAARETALASLDQASRRAARLVEDLLYLATLEHEPIRARAPVRLDDVVLGVVREAAGLRSDVAIRIAKLDEATAHGDSLALQQLLLNLVDNALSASPTGGKVRVALAAGDDHATITVTDSGPGIPPSELTRIFDRFYSKRTGAGRGTGAGLGLAIARAIATEHDGRLVARNEPAGRPASGAGRNRGGATGARQVGDALVVPRLSCTVARASLSVSAADGAAPRDRVAASQVLHRRRPRVLHRSSRGDLPQPPGPGPLNSPVEPLVWSPRIALQHPRSNKPLGPPRA
jgi:two-component system, OmpR family, sensor kinase